MDAQFYKGFTHVLSSQVFLIYPCLSPKGEPPTPDPMYPNYLGKQDPDMVRGGAFQ